MLAFQPRLVGNGKHPRPWGFAVLGFFCVLLSSPSLAQERGAGLLFDDSAYLDLQRVDRPSGGARVLPESASLSRYAPEVGDQGPSASSASWALAYSAYSIAQARLADLHPGRFTFDGPYSPFYVQNGTRELPESSGDCMTPTRLTDVLLVLTEKGSIPMRSQQIKCGESFSASDDDVARAHRILDHARLFHPASANKVRPVKEALVSGRPVVVGMHAPSSFRAARTPVWTPPEPYEGFAEGDGHALTVVEYDDQRFGGAFRLLNSWGADWGEDGYVWVRYDDFAHYVRYAVIIYLTEAAPEVDPAIKSRLRLQLLSGGEMEFEWNGSSYVSTKSYSAGTQFEAFLQISAPAFLYVFATDLSRDVEVLIPEPGGSLHLKSPDQEVPLLSGPDIWELKEMPGRTYLTVLLSPTELDVSRLAMEVKTGGRDHLMRLHAALDRMGIRVGSTNFSRAGDGATVVVLEIKHSLSGLAPDVYVPVIALQDSNEGIRLSGDSVYVEVDPELPPAALMGYADDDSGIAQFLVDGVLFPLPRDGNLKIPLPHLRGDTTFVVLSATDNAGNLTEMTVGIVRPPMDHTGPEIAILSPRVRTGTEPSDARGAAGGRFTIRGVVTDDSALEGVYVNGMAVSLGADSAFQVEIVLGPGERVFQVRAVDQLGNATTEVYTIQ